MSDPFWGEIRWRLVIIVSDSSRVFPLFVLHAFLARRW